MRSAHSLSPAAATWSRHGEMPRMPCRAQPSMICGSVHCCRTVAVLSDSRLASGSFTMAGYANPSRAIASARVVVWYLAIMFGTSHAGNAPAFDIARGTPPRPARSGPRGRRDTTAGRQPATPRRRARRRRPDTLRAQQASLHRARPRDPQRLHSTAGSMYSTGCHASAAPWRITRFAFEPRMHRVVRVARARGRLEIPEHPDFRVHALDAVVDLAVGVHVQAAVALHDPCADNPGTLCNCVTCANCAGLMIGGPALRAENLDVVASKSRIAPGKALPLHEVDEVGRDVDEAFALLLDVEEPRGPLDRRAGDELREMVDAFLDDGRFLAPSLPATLAEHRRNARERLLQHRRDLVALGHDVVEQHALGLAASANARRSDSKPRAVDRHRLVGEHVHAGVDRASDDIRSCAGCCRR